MQVTKNISQGEPISDLRELIRLANERKSVVIMLGLKPKVISASFLIGWPLRSIAQSQIFYSIKK